MKSDGQFSWHGVIKVNGDMQAIYINGRWLAVNKVMKGVIV